MQVALILHAPGEFDINHVDEEANIRSILSDLGCVESYDSPVTQPLAVLLSEVHDGIAGVPPFRLGGDSRTQWIRRIADATRLLAYTVTSFQGDRLQWHTDLCRLCLGRRHDVTDCDLLSSVSRQHRQLSGICGYPLCKSTGAHSTYFCSHLNARCSVCHFRGHLSSDEVCEDMEKNYDLFNAWSSHGYLTQNCDDIKAASCGFFPVLTVTENKLLEALGGYQFLQSMSPVDAVDFCRSLAANERRLVGAEPFITELCVRSSLEYFSRRRARPGPHRSASRGFGRGNRRGRGLPSYS